MWYDLQLFLFVFVAHGVLLCSETTSSTETAPTPSQRNDTTLKAISVFLSPGRKTLTSHVTNYRCYIRYCNCFLDHVDCYWPQHRWRVIPRVPSITRHLRIRNANLQTLTRHTLFNLLHVQLLSLALDWNNITHVTADAFEDLLNLTSLTLRGNPIPGPALRACFFSILNPSFSVLVLDNTRLASIPDDFFDGLANRKISRLTLDNNHITIFNNAAFAKFASVQTLRLRNNRISELNLSSRAHIVKLVLDRNMITELPDFCLNKSTHETIEKPASAIENLTVLDLGQNEFHELPKKKFLRDCLPDLQALYVRFCTRLKTLENNFISDLPKIRTLRLLQLPSLVRYEPFAFNSTTLEKLAIIHNRKIDYHSINVSEIFQRLPRLKVSNCISLNLTDTHGSCSRFYQI